MEAKKKLDFLIRSSTEIPHLKYIVTLKETDQATIEIGSKKGLVIFSFADILVSFFMINSKYNSDYFISEHWKW